MAAVKIMNKDESRAKQLSELPKSVKGIYSKAFKRSKANAVKAKCLECVCNIREEVRLCIVYTCPLYEVRPYQEKKV